MRDLLPPESRARRRVSEALQAVFDRSGYELITTPLFERVEVFERGFTLDPRDLLRFVDPESGEVAALRPDMTPQIARVVSTRLADHPSPWRLRYEGTVIRQRRGRARRQRQIAQVGIELIGVAGTEADLEVIGLTSAACTAAGLDTFRIELSEVGVGRALLDAEGPGLLEAASEALARKDESLLIEALARAGVSKEAQARLAQLVHLHGDLSVLQEAKALVRGTAAEAHLASLEDVAQQLVARGLGPKLGVDLGEIRGAAYYTGVSFALYAPGPGEAVATGGRYDELLGRYGRAQPATGAGIDLENLLWALDHQGRAWRERPGTRFLVYGNDAEGVQAAVHALHAASFTAAILPGSDPTSALAYARAWGYDVVLAFGAQDCVAVRASDEEQHQLMRELNRASIDALATFSRALRGD
jgi:ATP phosphoribosyltransferase regulatory subunit